MNRRMRSNRRQARQAGKRARVVHGGLTGGTFKPLTDREIEHVHLAALEVLHTVGIGDPTQELLDIVLPHGCFLGPQDRLCFPPALIEDVLSHVPSEFTTYARGSKSPDWDAHFSGTRVYNGIGTEAVFILDMETNRFRNAVIGDLYDLTRVTDTLDNVHLAGQVAHPSDIEMTLEQDINTIYAIASATEKPFSMAFRERANIAQGMELLDAIAGGAGEFIKRPFCTFGPIAVISPLRFEFEGLGILIEMAQRGLIPDASCAPMVGATAPAALPGTLVQAVAEMLAQIAIANLIHPGLPMFFAPWNFVVDFRTGAAATSAGEGAILAAAMTQIGNHYGLPSSQGACMTDAKLPDAQAGYEKGISGVLLAQAGCNRIQACAGMLNSTKCCAHEALIIDNDMLGSVMRTVRGLEISEATLSVEVIRQSALNEGHYLGHKQTLSLMESHFLYPEVADRSPMDLWEDAGSPTIFDKAREKARTILDNHYPNYLGAALDEKIRAKWKIHLPPARMKRALDA